MSRLHVGVLLLLSLLTSLAAATSVDPGYPPKMKPWSEVEAIERAAARAKSPAYQSRRGHYVLAPEGRFLWQMAHGDDEEGKSAMLGRYTREGNVLTIRFEGTAVDVDSLSDEQREQYEAYQAEAAQAVALHEEASEDSDETDDADRGERDDAHRRLLVLPYRGGEALVDADNLVDIANAWNGVDALAFYPEAWRVPGLDPKSDHEFKIEDPLNANLPWELSRLLRKDAIEARVSEALDNAETLVWKQQSTDVRVRLDRGSQHGLYKDMYVYGLPPDERVYAVLEEVQSDSAIAKISLERFAPQDAVDLPTVGMRLITRRGGKGEGCGIDYSAAVRGKVLTVATAPADVRFDDEGYAWFELTLDQGSTQGLSLEDRLTGEDYSLDGEGRVRGLSSDRATVLWRVQRWSEDQELILPKSGTALVTPAWQRAAFDVFGSEAAMSK